MRIIRIVLILLAIYILIFPNKMFASEDLTADTNTKNIPSIFSESFLSNIESIKENSENEKTKEEIENEKIIEKWKIKQDEKWNNLPKEPFIINASAYTASADECGNDKGITASGIKVKEKRTIACPPEFPFGLKLEIEGMGIYVCEDRGGAIKGNHIDIFVKTKKEAFNFGRQNLSAKIVQS